MRYIKSWTSRQVTTMIKHTGSSHALEFEHAKCESPGDGCLTTTAEWLAGLSEQARDRGDAERADRLLLLAWQAFDGQPIDLSDINASGQVPP